MSVVAPLSCYSHLSFGHASPSSCSNFHIAFCICHNFRSATIISAGSRVRFAVRGYTEGEGVRGGTLLKEMRSFIELCLLSSSYEMQSYEIGCSPFIFLVIAWQRIG